MKVLLNVFAIVLNMSHRGNSHLKMTTTTQPAPVVSAFVKVFKIVHMMAIVYFTKVIFTIDT